MTAGKAADRARRIGAWLVGAPRRTASAWAVATLVLLVALGGGPGISRDEAAVLEAADRSLRAPGATGRAAPPLSTVPAAVARAALSPLGVPRVRAARLPSAVAGAILSALLALLAWELSGSAGALLAPGLFWAAPRHLYAGLVGTPDVTLAALSLGLALAWRRAVSGPDRRSGIQAAIGAGVVLGAALATRTDAWVLGAALALHVAVARAVGARSATPPGAAPAPSGRTLLAVLALGAVVLVGLWPALLWSADARAAAFATAGRAAAEHALGGAARGVVGAVFPLGVIALTVPAAILVASVGGVVHALARIIRAVRGEEGPPAADELLLLLFALVPLVAAAAGLGPAARGVRPILHALPFLALLGARALLRAAELAWPARAAPLAASLALLALWPAVRATAHALPSGASAWNDLAGGAPGAATLRLPRSDGGDAALRLVDAVNARAREGARVWWPSSAPAAIHALALDGRLRADLAVADGPDDADVAVVAVDAASGRDAEYRAWTAFRTARPVAGAYLDEVPLALAYARPGAWR